MKSLIDGNCLSEGFKDYEASASFFLDLQPFLLISQRLLLMENK